MCGEGRKVVRLSWEEWQRGRAARREALAKKGLAAPCRRSTAKPNALAALAAFMPSKALKCAKIVVFWMSLALAPAAALAQQPAKSAAAGVRPLTGGAKYQATAPLQARLWLYPEGVSPESPEAKPKSQRGSVIGRDPSFVYLAPERDGGVPQKIAISRVAGVDFEIDYDRFAVSKAMAKSEWGKAIPILRKAYSPFFTCLDLPGNNVLEGAYDLGVTMFKSARAAMRAASSADERGRAAQQYQAAQDVFNACAKAKWSDFGALAQIRALHCMVLIDSEKARRASRMLAAMEEPLPGDFTYGYYWLLKAELAKLAGNTGDELDAAVKSLAHENKDVETFPDALMLSAECYEALGNHYRARDLYFEVAKLFPGTDWGADALANLERVMASGLTAEKEDATAESTFFGLEEDMNALANELVKASKSDRKVFDYDEEEADAGEK